jgi:hypothetical protein
MVLYTASIDPGGTRVRVNVIPVWRETETNWFVPRSDRTFGRSKVTKKRARRYGWGLTPAEAIDYLIGVSGFTLERLAQLQALEERRMETLNAAKNKAVEEPGWFEQRFWYP